MATTRRWIVWNRTKTEGLVTGEHQEAIAVSTGKWKTPLHSTLGDQFREIYGHSGKFEVQEILVDVDT